MTPVIWTDEDKVLNFSWGRCFIPFPFEKQVICKMVLRNLKRRKMRHTFQPHPLWWWLLRFLRLLISDEFCTNSFLNQIWITLLEDSAKKETRILIAFKNFLIDCEKFPQESTLISSNSSANITYLRASCFSHKHVIESLNMRLIIMIWF